MYIYIYIYIYIHTQTHKAKQLAEINKHLTKRSSWPRSA